MKTFIVIPAYNEQKYLHKVLTKVLRYTHNLIVIDDGSTDQTFSIASALVRHTLRHELNLGKGAAMKTGCEYAFNKLHADAVVFFDSDDQHDANLLPEFLAKLEQGNHLVFGIREFSKDIPAIRIFINKLTSYAVRVLFGSYVPDIPSGFKAMSVTAYNQIKWDSADYGVEVEIAARVAKQKLSFAIVPMKVAYHDLDRGMNVIDGLKVTAKLIEWGISL